VTAATSALAPSARLCAGVPITVCSPAEAADEVIRLATQTRERGVDVHLCNAYTLALADEHADFRHMLGRATHNFADGQSLVWADRLLHRDVRGPGVRVYGPDLFLDVMALGRTASLKHFLLGSTPEVLVNLEVQLRALLPGVDIVGASSPPFRSLTEIEELKQLELLASSGAQIVWLGLGTPKQDWEAARLSASIPAVFCAVGAAFDFVAGNKNQAPHWMQKRGLEWLFRLCSEPRRLWKRYLFGNVRFAKAVIKHGLSSSRARVNRLSYRADHNER
jgi:N-acetylglucosaminyldiphosphoundecaprenol N-acetyl-beta-D-mannosaminyltransferase